MNFNKLIMKSSILSKSVLAVIAILLSTLSCLGQDDPSDKVAGTWIKTSDMGSVTFTFSADKKYEVEFTGDGTADVTGSYVISGQQITFTDTGGDYRSDSDGVYEFTVSDSLTFTKVDDPVDGRRRLMEGTWSKATD